MKKFLLFSCLLLAINGLFAQSSDSNIVQKGLNDIEVEAEFPGGIPAWTAYLRKSLDPTVPIKKGARRGSYVVIVRFIVDRNGKVVSTEAETKHGYGMEEEAMRVIKESPDWIPAQQNGRYVNAYRRQPIAFKVTNR